jgi:Bardet-Biedl syndrome 9 protein
VNSERNLPDHNYVLSQEELANRAAQLRAVQRRLLLRFRDKNPLPLTQLEILFEGSLDQVGDCLNFMEENELVSSRNLLSIF